VSFGDVNLSNEQIRESAGVQQNPGAGGWPTIRYFNKETGYGGAAYVKKTSEAMCTELGNEDNMQAYIEEAGKTSLCAAPSGDGCSEREVKFINTWTQKPQADVEKQLARLEKMSGDSMKAELKKWITQRIAILKQLQSSPKDEI